MRLELLYHPILEAAGAALIHSVWQGVVVAGSLFVALRLFKHTDSYIRYALCGTALLLLFLLPVSTGVQIYVSGQTGPAVHHFPNEPLAVNVYAEQKEAIREHKQPVGEAPVDGKVVQESKHAPLAWRSLLVGLWLIGVMLFLFRLTGGLITVNRLKKSGHIVDDPALISAFNSLLTQFGINRAVLLRVTVYIDEPMVIGWLRPVVLLPLSVATNLPPEQVEAILAHELAHVRRQDYVVLILQSVAEILFFYHPATWWISRQMRVEREYCCDALTTSVMDNELVYVRALTNLESQRVERLALGANNGSLVERIQRITFRKQERKQRSRFSWLGVGLLTMCCSLLVTACLEFGQPDLNGTPDELYALASLKVSEHDFNAALPYAEKAAQEGHMCSMMLLSEMYRERGPNFTGEDGTRYVPVSWAYKNQEMALKWAQSLKEFMHEKAAAGDSDAMMMLALGYRENYSLGSYDLAFQENDSLAYDWADRAAEAGNPYAVRWQAQRIASKQQEFNLSDSLFTLAAEMGDKSAYFWWSMNYARTPEPQRYFEILDMWLQDDPAGAYERIRETLDALNEQIALGNEESIIWKAIADSFSLEQRLEMVSGNTDQKQIFPEFKYREQCDLDWNWFMEVGG